MLYDCARPHGHPARQAVSPLFRKPDREAGELLKLMIGASASSALPCIIHGPDDNHCRRESRGHISTQGGSGYSVYACQYKPPNNLDEPLGRPNAVKEADKEANLHWKDGTQRPHKYVSHCHNFAKMLRQFENMWYGQVRSIKAAQQRIGLSNQRTALYFQPGTGPALSQENVTNRKSRGCSPWTFWAVPCWIGITNLVRAKEWRPLRFCIDYQELNVVTIRNSFPITLMDKGIHSLANGTIFVTLDGKSGYW